MAQCVNLFKNDTSQGHTDVIWDFPCRCSCADLKKKKKTYTGVLSNVAVVLTFYLISSFSSILELRFHRVIQIEKKFIQLCNIIHIGCGGGGGGGWLVPSVASVSFTFPPQSTHLLHTMWGLEFAAAFTVNSWKAAISCTI